jgi:tetratricopeptide (TPR) repeat protein
LPDQSHPRQGEANPPSDAVRLFAQSAQAADVHFTLDQTTRPLVTQICRLLHGLPLGIELAASWLRFLTLAEIAQEITQNLNFLDTGLEALPDQQRSLRAVFMHSWRLLAGAEQQTLRRLAVFRGGFTRAAAQQVAGATLPLLAALGDKSLLQRNDPTAAPGGGSTTGQRQYRLHTVIHQYAAEQLALAQETAAYQQRHALYMLDLLAAQQPDLNSARQQTALALIDSEIENLRAAWQWLLDQWQTAPATLVASPTQISQGIESLFHFYDMRSWFQEGEAFFGQLAQKLGAFAASQPAATAPNSEALRQIAEQLAAKAQARQGWFAFHLGHHAESRRLLETSLQRLQQIQAITETIFNLNYLGALLRHLGEFAQATTHLQAALQLAQQHNDPMNTSIALNILGQVASLQGDLPEAQRLCQQALQIKRAIGDRWGMTFSLTYLGRVLQSSGDYAAAQKHFAESLAICQELGDQRGAAFALQNLGDTAFARGDLATASQRYQASLAIYHAIGNRAEQSLTLARLGETYRAGGEVDQARQALLDALALAWALPSTPGLLAALLGLAALDLTVGQPAQATPWLRYVYQHPTSTPQPRQQAAQLLASAGADGGEPLAVDDGAVISYVERVLSHLQAPTSLDL